MNAPLDAETFRLVVASTPLVAIDLVIDDGAGRFLLGLRKNRPAKGAWFVPGGRIYKNERLDDAFTRIAAAELGPHAIGKTRENARFLGVFEHLYEDGFGGAEASTHYVVLGYAFTVTGLDLATLPSAQHGEYRLVTRDALLADARVHDNTRRYFV